MFTIRRLAIFLLVILICASAWVWWSYPRKVDMARYVPSDSLAYFEANDIPAVLTGMTDTEAWKALALPAGIRADLGEVGWISKISKFTGIGTAETVVFSRAQIAVAVVGIFGNDKGDVLQIKPRYAVVMETHTSESRLLSVIEKRIASFAERAYGNPEKERKAINGAQLLYWKAPQSERKIVAAVIGSVAIIGNDEEAVLKCLAVHHGEAQNLSGNAELQSMRLRFSESESVAFGFVSSKGAAQVFQILGSIYAAQSTDDPRALNLIAGILPQLTQKFAGPIGWNSRFAGSGVEDRYFITAPQEVTASLKQNLEISPNVTLKAADFLPAESFSLTCYNAKNLQAAWRGLGLALSLPLDVISANAVPLILNGALRTYGIEAPDTFLQTVGPEIYTARIEDKSNNTIVIASVQNETTLQAILKQKLGAQIQTEKIGDAVMLYSTDTNRGAFSITNGYLLMGSANNVRRCLQAFATKTNLSSALHFQKASAISANALNANSVTITDDKESVRALLLLFTTLRFAKEKEPDYSQFENGLKQLSYFVTETRIVEGGVERKTRSAFGQFGNLAVQFGGR